MAIALLSIYPGLGRFWAWARSSSSELAAWVQAFGSIAALAGGLAVAQYQVRQQRRENAEREKSAHERRIATFKALLIQAEAVSHKIAFETLDGKVSSVPWATVRLIEVNGLSNFLDRLDPHDFSESPVLLDALSVATASAQALAAELNAYVHNFGQRPQSAESVNFIARSVLGNFQMISERVDAVLDLMRLS